MPSKFDDDFAGAIDLIVENFGDRDAAGAYKPVEYRPTGSRWTAEPYRWPAVVSGIAAVSALNDRGEFERRETRTVDVKASLVAADHVQGFQSDATIAVDGELWHVDEDTTQWGPSMITFGLVRVPLVRKPELRSNAAV